MTTAEKGFDRAERKGTRRLIGVVLGLIALAALPGVAHAQVTDDLRLTLVFTGCEGDDGRVALSGAITGVGVDTRQGFQQNPDGSFAFESLFVLDGGTLRVNGGGQVQTFTVHPTSGVARFTFTGSFTIAEGTGVYAGANGSGAFSGRAVLVPDEGCPSGGRVAQVTRGDGNVTFDEPTPV